MAAEGSKLATGWLELVVSTAGAQESMTREVAPAAAAAGEAGAASLGGKLVGGIGKFIAPLGALLAGVGVGKLIGNSTEAFESLVAQTNALQRIAGGTKEQVSGLVGAMQLSGVAADQVQGSLTIFSKNLGNASADGTKTAAMAKLLGGNFLDAAGNVKPMSDILPGLADKFASMPDGAQKTALAVQLFGRSGAQLLPFLNKGSAGIADFTAQAQKMGLVVDDVAGGIFARARLSTRQYQAATQGLLVTLGQNLTPVLDGLANVYRAAVIPVLQTTTAFLAAHRDQFLAVGETLEKVADTVGTKISALLGGLSGFGSGIGGVIAAIVPFAGVLLGPLSGGIGSLIGSLGRLIPGVGLLAGPFTALSGPVGIIIGLLGTLIATSPQLREALGGAFTAIMAALAPVLTQLGGVFQSLVGTLTPVISQLAVMLGGTLADAVTQLAPIIAQVAGILGGVLVQAVGLLQPILAALLPVVTQVVAVFAGVFSAVLQALLPVISQLVSVLGGTLAKIFPTLTPIITRLAGVLSGVFLTVLNALAPVIVQLANTLGPILGQVLTALAPIITLIAQVFGQVLAAVAPLIGPIIGLVTPILGLISPILQLISPLLQLVGQILQPLIQLFTSLLTPILGLIQPIIGLLVPVLQVVVTVLTAIVTGVVDAITWFVNLVTGSKTAQSQLSSVWNGVLSFFSGLWSGIVGFFRDGINNAISFVRGLPGQVLNAIGNLGSLLYNAGRDMIQGLLNGAGSLLKTIGSFFLSILPGWIVGPFKAALGIHSPSTVFFGHGSDIVQGAINGIVSRGADLRDAVGSLAADATLTASQSIGAVTFGAGGPGSSAGDSGPLDLSDSTIQKLAVAVAQITRVQARMG